MDPSGRGAGAAEGRRMNKSGAAQALRLSMIKEAAGEEGRVCVCASKSIPARWR